MLTTTQQLRVEGFREALIERGIAVRLEGATYAGRPVAFVALEEQLGNTPDEFETGAEQRNMTKLHILNQEDCSDSKPDPRLALVGYAGVLVETGSGRRHNVLVRESRDIKTVFTCRVDEPAA